MAANINVDKALRVSTERDDDVAVTEVLPKRSHPRSSSCPALASCRKIARKSLSTARADLLGRKAAAAGSNDIVVILTSLRNATNGTRQIQNTPWGPAPTWLLARSLHHRGRHEKLGINNTILYSIRTASARAAVHCRAQTRAAARCLAAQ